MAESVANSPNFNNVNTQFKRRVNTEDLKKEMRNIFKTRLRLNRDHLQDRGRRLSVTLKETIAKEHGTLRSQLILDNTENQDELLELLDEIYKELLLFDEDTVMLDIMRSQDFEVESILENNHVFCKVCNQFIEQTTENSNVFICRRCIDKYFVD